MISLGPPCYSSFWLTRSQLKSPFCYPMSPLWKTSPIHRSHSPSKGRGQQKGDSHWGSFLEFCLPHQPRFKHSSSNGPWACLSLDPGLQCSSCMERSSHTCPEVQITLTLTLWDLIYMRSPLYQCPWSFCLHITHLFSKYYQSIFCGTCHTVW